MEKAALIEEHTVHARSRGFKEKQADMQKRRKAGSES